MLEAGPASASLAGARPLFTSKQRSSDPSRHQTWLYSGGLLISRTLQPPESEADERYAITIDAFDRVVLTRLKPADAEPEAQWAIDRVCHPLPLQKRVLPSLRCDYRPAVRKPLPANCGLI